MEEFTPDQPILPVFINSFNRLGCLREQVSWLEKIPYVKIIILDNGSTFEPLSAYYKSIKHDIIFMRGNHGKMALFELHDHTKQVQLQHQFAGHYYVYTDPDIIPLPDCPLDLFKKCKAIMDADYHLYKVGPALDLSKAYNFPLLNVINDEKRNWDAGYFAPGDDKLKLYLAYIDTTMALYDKRRQPAVHPECWVPYHFFTQSPAVRTGHPYIARHTTWELDYNNLPDDERYYATHATGLSSTYSTSWIGKFLNKPATPQLL